MALNLQYSIHMKTNAKDILSSFLILCLMTTPSLSFAAPTSSDASYVNADPVSPTQNPSSTYIPAPSSDFENYRSGRIYAYRYDDNEKYLYIRTQKDSLPMLKHDGQYAGVAIKLASPEEVEKNRPSFVARQLRKTPDMVVNFTMQYVFFQAALQLVAISNLATNYAGNPLAIQKAIKSMFSAEGVVGFAGFTVADWGVKRLIQDLAGGTKFAESKLVPFLGMAGGMLASTIIGEMFNDVNFKLCAKSAMRDLDHCDKAFETWALSNKIIQYMPIIVQMGGASKISEAITKRIPYLKEERLAERSANFGKSVFLNVERIGFNAKAAEWAASKAFTIASGPAIIANLLFFMASDAVVASPIGKLVSDNYFDEQRDVTKWLQDQKVLRILPPGLASAIALQFDIAHSSFLSRILPIVPWKLDRNTQDLTWGQLENINRLDLDYANAADAESKKKHPELSWIGRLYRDLIMAPKEAEKLKREVKLSDSYINYPTDQMHIMKEAHDGILAALKFEQENNWNEFDVTACKPTLSTNHQLNIEEAQKFNTLTEKEKECFIKIGLYDNLAKYISLSARHRTNIFSKMFNDIKEWTEALDKFRNMEAISAQVTQYLSWSHWAYAHAEPSFNDPSMADTDLPRIHLNYDAFDKLVKKVSKAFGRTDECEAGNLECEEKMAQEQEHFLPRFVGDIKIRNLTDYLIVQAVCGPDVKDTKNGFYRGWAPQFYSITENTSVAYNNFINLISFSNDRLSFNKTVFPSSDSAMIEFPMGSYPKFYPPRLVNKKADIDICKHQASQADVDVMNAKFSKDIAAHKYAKVVYGSVRDNLFKTSEIVNGKSVVKQYHLFDYLTTHFDNDNLVINPKNDSDIQFKHWYADNVDTKVNPTYDGFQRIFAIALDRDFFPPLEAKGFKVGCENTGHETPEQCLRDWTKYKVAKGALQSMDVEAYELLGILRTLFMSPDYRLMMPRYEHDFKTLSTSEIKTPPQDESLQTLDQLTAQFITEFKSIGLKDKDLVPDKNGLKSVKVDQAAAALEALSKEVMAKKTGHIKALQAAAMGLIFKELAGLMQEKATYAEWRTVSLLRNVVDRELPETKHKEKPNAGLDLLKK